MPSGETLGSGNRDRFVEKHVEADAPKPSDTERASTLSDPSMLDAVLNATSSEPREPITEREMNALRQVAKRYLGRPFELEPVAIALVDAILRVQLRRPNETDEFWRTMSTEIATTLCDTVETNERLSRFWKRLCESVS